MEARWSPRKRWLRWSVSALMGVVAAVAILLATALAWMRPELPAPGHVLEQLPLRMHRLRPGMTERRVWRELGLAGYRKGGMMGGGPDRHFWRSYSPGPGSYLLMYTDETGDPPRFVGARLSCRQGVFDAPDPTLQRPPAAR